MNSVLTPTLANQVHTALVVNSAPLSERMFIRYATTNEQIRPALQHVLRGHSLGHVIFVLDEEHLVFSGDLIFKQGVGRTDLPGGDWRTLLQSIEENILTLPDDYLLLSGHGPETTVGDERRMNPFLV